MCIITLRYNVILLNVGLLAIMSFIYNIFRRTQNGVNATFKNYIDVYVTIFFLKF